MPFITWDWTVLIWTSSCLESLLFSLSFVLHSTASANVAPSEVDKPLVPTLALRTQSIHRFVSLNEELVCKPILAVLVVMTAGSHCWIVSCGPNKSCFAQSTSNLYPDAVKIALHVQAAVLVAVPFAAFVEKWKRHGLRPASGAREAIASTD